MPHSSCDADIKSCVCNEDFYNDLGTCTAAPSELCQHIVVSKIVPLHEIDLEICMAIDMLGSISIASTTNTKFLQSFWFAVSVTLF